VFRFHPHGTDAAAATAVRKINLASTITVLGPELLDFLGVEVGASAGGR
jgi:hypothetical protein